MQHTPNAFSSLGRIERDGQTRRGLGKQTGRGVTTKSEQSHR